MIAARPSPLVSDKHRIDSVASTDHATKASHSKHSHAADNHHKRQQDKKDAKVYQQSVRCKTDTAEANDTKHGSVTSEYTVDKIVKHVTTGDNIWCVVHWNENIA